MSKSIKDSIISQAATEDKEALKNVADSYKKVGNAAKDAGKQGKQAGEQLNLDYILPSLGKIEKALTIIAGKLDTVASKEEDIKSIFNGTATNETVFTKIKTQIDDATSSLRTLSSFTQEFQEKALTKDKQFVKTTMGKVGLANLKDGLNNTSSSLLNDKEAKSLNDTLQSINRTLGEIVGRLGDLKVYSAKEAETSLSNAQKVAQQYQKQIVKVGDSQDELNKKTAELKKRIEKDNAGNTLARYLKGNIVDEDRLAKAIKLLQQYYALAGNFDDIEGKFSLVDPETGKKIEQSLGQMIKTAIQRDKDLAVQFEPMINLEKAKESIKEWTDILDKARARESSTLSVNISDTSIEALANASKQISVVVDALKPMSGGTFGLEEKDIQAITAAFKGVSDELGIIAKKLDEIIPKENEMAKTLQQSIQEIIAKEGPIQIELDPQVEENGLNIKIQTAVSKAKPEVNVKVKPEVDAAEFVNDIEKILKKKKIPVDIEVSDLVDSKVNEDQLLSDDTVQAVKGKLHKIVSTFGDELSESVTSFTSNLEKSFGETGETLQKELQNIDYAKALSNFREELEDIVDRFKDSVNSVSFESKASELRRVFEEWNAASKMLLSAGRTDLERKLLYNSKTNKVSVSHYSGEESNVNTAPFFSYIQKHEGLGSYDTNVHSHPVRNQIVRKDGSITKTKGSNVAFSLGDIYNQIFNVMAKNANVNKLMVESGGSYSQLDLSGLSQKTLQVFYQKLVERLEADTAHFKPTVNDKGRKTFTFVSEAFTRNGVRDYDASTDIVNAHIRAALQEASPKIKNDRLTTGLISDLKGPFDEMLSKEELAKQEAYEVFEALTKIADVLTQIKNSDVFQFKGLNEFVTAIQTLGTAMSQISQNIKDGSLNIGTAELKGWEELKGSIDGVVQTIGEKSETNEKSLLGIDADDLQPVITAINNVKAAIEGLNQAKAELAKEEANDNSWISGLSEDKQKEASQIEEILEAAKTELAKFDKNGLFTKFLFGEDGGLRTKEDFIAMLDSLLVQARTEMTQLANLPADQMLTEIQKVYNKYFAGLRAGELAGYGTATSLLSRKDLKGVELSEVQSYKLSPYFDETQYNDDVYSILAKAVEMQGRLNALKEEARAIDNSQRPVKVGISPDASNFISDIEKQIEGTPVEVNIKPVFNGNEITDNADVPKIPVLPDSSKFISTLQQDIASQPVEVEVKPNSENFIEQLRQKLAGSTSKAPKTPTVKTSSYEYYKKGIEFLEEYINLSKQANSADWRIADINWVAENNNRSMDYAPISKLKESIKEYNRLKTDLEEAKTNSLEIPKEIQDSHIDSLNRLIQKEYEKIIKYTIGQKQSVDVSKIFGKKNSELYRQVIEETEAITKAFEAREKLVNGKYSSLGLQYIMDAADRGDVKKTYGNLWHFEELLDTKGIEAAIQFLKDKFKIELPQAVQQGVTEAQSAIQNTNLEEKLRQSEDNASQIEIPVTVVPDTSNFAKALQDKLAEQEPVPVPVKLVTSNENGTPSLIDEGKTILSPFNSEIDSLAELATAVISVTEYIDEKTQAFKNEEATVKDVISSEIIELDNLITSLSSVKAWVEQINGEFSNFKNIEITFPKFEKKDAERFNTILHAFDGIETQHIQEVIDALSQIKQNVSFEKGSTTLLSDLEKFGTTFSKSGQEVKTTATTIAENIQKIANGITNLKAAFNGVNLSDNTNQFLSQINAMLDKGEALANLATVLKQSSEKIERASKTVQTTKTKEQTDREKTDEVMAKTETARIKREEEEALREAQQVNRGLEEEYKERERARAEQQKQQEATDKAMARAEAARIKREEEAARKEAQQVNRGLEEEYKAKEKQAQKQQDATDWLSKLDKVSAEYKAELKNLTDMQIDAMGKQLSEQEVQALKDQRVKVDELKRSYEELYSQRKKHASQFSESKNSEVRHNNSELSIFETDEATRKKMAHQNSVEAEGAQAAQDRVNNRADSLADSLEKKLRKAGNASDEVKEKVQELITLLRQHSDENFFSGITNNKDAKNKIADITKEVEKAKEALADSGSIQTVWKSLEQMSKSSKYTDAFSKQITDEMTKSGFGQGGKWENFNPLDATHSQKEIEEYQEAVEKLLETFKELKEQGKLDINLSGNMITIDKLRSKVADTIAENSRMNGTDIGRQFEQYQARLQAIANAGQASREATKAEAAEFIRLEAAMKEAGLTGLSLFDQIKNKVAGINKSFIGMYFSFYDMVRYAREMATTVTELDTAFTEMRKVSDESVKSLKDYQDRTFDLATSVGTTALDLQNSTAEFMRLGQGLDEASESALNATKLMNVSEFENISDATDALIAMKAAYDDLSQDEIIDKLNNIGNNFSISTSDLGTSLQRAASVLKTQGNDIDEAIALITAGNAVTRDSDMTAAGIRTISLRIAGTEEAKQELADIGEEVEDYVVMTNAKKREIIRDYTAVASNNGQGVDILNDNGNLKNTYKILLEISKVYKEIQEEDKKFGTNRASALIEELAGKNRSQIAASILMNGDLLESVYKSSQNSEGSAQQELDKYLDSIQGRVSLFQNELQRIIKDTLDSDLVKEIVDLGTEGLKTVDQFAKIIGPALELIVNPLIEILGLVNQIVSALGPWGTTGLMGALFGGTKFLGRDKTLSLFLL